MGCDLSALANLDTSDPEQAAALLQECVGVLSSPSLWLWAIALTVVGALVGALIGKYKNAIVRDAVLGAALGPIGWIVSWFLPVRTAPPTCPACQRRVDAGDAHCRHCGASLNA